MPPGKIRLEIRTALVLGRRECARRRGNWAKSCFLSFRGRRSPTRRRHLSASKDFQRASRARLIWVKRDDCTGLAEGGNKVRKLAHRRDRGAPAEPCLQWQSDGNSYRTDPHRPLSTRSEYCLSAYRRKPSPSRRSRIFPALKAARWHNEMAHQVIRNGAYEIWEPSPPRRGS